jgi:hypothetical protein
VKLGLPDVSAEIDGFRRELTAIRELLERLLEIEEARQ